MKGEPVIRAIIDISLPLFFPLGGSELQLKDAAWAVARGRTHEPDFTHFLFGIPGTLKFESPWTLSDRSDAFCSLVFGLYYGFQNWLSTQDQDLLEAFPAQSLINVIGPDSEFSDAKARWVKSGGLLRSGQMIALKNDPIWRKMSLFGFPFPPFTPTSGLGVEDVSREEAFSFGLKKSDLNQQRPEAEFSFSSSHFKSKLSSWIAGQL